MEIKTTNLLYVESVGNGNNGFTVFFCPETRDLKHGTFRKIGLFMLLVCLFVSIVKYQSRSLYSAVDFLRCLAKSIVVAVILVSVFFLHSLALFISISPFYLKCKCNEAIKKCANKCVMFVIVMN